MAEWYVDAERSNPYSKPVKTTYDVIPLTEKEAQTIRKLNKKIQEIESIFDKKYPTRESRTTEEYEKRRIDFGINYLYRKRSAILEMHHKGARQITLPGTPYKEGQFLSPEHARIVEEQRRRGNPPEPMVR